MKQIQNIFLAVMGAVVMLSCNKQIQEKQLNPNNPSSVPPGLILGTVLLDMSGTGSAGGLGGIDSWDNVQDWNQYHCQNYNYYGNNIYSWANGSFDPYLVMKNVDQMDQEVLVRGGSAVNPYEALGRFIKSYYYYNLTSMYGDVPQTEALNSAVTSTPAYTPQAQVFAYILGQLDTANSDLTTLIAANDNSLLSSQDLYYQGNLSAWQKVVNTFRLRVLISLSDQSADATLNVPAQFADIFNNPTKYPVFTSEGDDFQFNYNPGGSNTYSTYPFNPSSFGSIAGRFNMAATYVSALTGLSDPRVYMTCDPAWGTVPTGESQPAQFKYFVGASTGLALGTMYANASAGLYSFIGRYRYYSNFTGEPDVLVGYKEMLFNVAEAMQRGWVAGNAETWYMKGITTSMGFYGIDVTKSAFTAYFLPPTATAVSQVAPYSFTFDWATYYAQPLVKLSATNTTAVGQIVLQKYLAMFENSGYEAYYNYRRVGVPAFQGGSGVGNNGVIPLRWSYPVSEQTQNATNYKAALTSQGFSADDLNQTMWLIK